MVSLSKYIVAMVVAVVVTILLIYLTPLKHVNLVELSIDDVSPGEFYEAYVGNEEDYVFLDVRSADAYNRVHAKGSLSMPLHTLYHERVNLPKNQNDKKIVLICSGGVASGVGYHYLEHHGFRNIQRLDGGIEAWQLAGLPIEAEI